MLELKIPTWFLKIKEIHSKNCGSVYGEDLNNKLGIESISQKKEILISMARSDAKRPSQKTTIGKALSDYTKRSSDTFDNSFYETISKIRPEWFFSQTEVANQKKQKLIEMAKNGEGRPSFEKTRLGQALSNYTRKSSFVYDHVFDKLIRKLRPDWFN